jgi:putative ABC transport system permease protein
MVMGQGLVLVGLGVVIGVAGALAVTRLIASQLFGVQPTDPSTFVPAMRDTRVDPVVALRDE